MAMEEIVNCHAKLPTTSQGNALRPDVISVAGAFLDAYLQLMRPAEEEIASVAWGSYWIAARGGRQWNGDPSLEEINCVAGGLGVGSLPDIEQQIFLKLRETVGSRGYTTHHPTPHDFVHIFMAAVGIAEDSEEGKLAMAIVQASWQCNTSFPPSKIAAAAVDMARAAESRKPYAPDLEGMSEYSRWQLRSCKATLAKIYYS
ncbi:unnamed protein product [Ostreobium quekettii]|uniref:Cyclin C-terminal domain-containing protein n=1 Tax=Ostreobium quekettii TaxID=121088 RepID=A0A8S1IWW0_9CHLO|nr:unnamed protein product [Ostreobium quekettii]